MTESKNRLWRVSKSDSHKRNLYLVGFMGTGKSTIGRRVAEELRLNFLDSDKVIEAKESRTIPEIFAQDGEATFRKMERDFIERGHPATGQVVACGGGLVVQEGMLPVLENKGVVICLVASFETILARVSGNQHRPLLNGDNQVERIRSLMAARDPIYQQVSTRIMTDHRPTWEVVHHVKRAYLESLRAHS